MENAGAERGETLQFATFYLNDELIGINILQVQEIQLPQPVTPVPRAPNFILGLISLRGQIIPLIDLRRRLRIEREEAPDVSYHIVVRGTSVIACLAVDGIGDVVTVGADQLRPAPDSVHAFDKKFMGGVCQLGNTVLTVLEVDVVLDIDLA